jgi:hypothetical protein
VITDKGNLHEIFKDDSPEKVDKLIRCSFHYLHSGEREVHSLDEISHDLVPDRMPLFELMALIREAIEGELIGHMPTPPSQEGDASPKRKHYRSCDQTKDR